MPVKRRREKRRIEEFTYDHLFHLIVGRDYFSSAYGEPPDLERARQDWFAHREEVLEECAANYQGKIPWAQTKFGNESPDAR